jgi:hypothetical protein
MKEQLNLDNCDEKQFKNGFDRFLKCYTDTKDKLSHSGFGVDPEVDQSLDKGFCYNFNFLYFILLCVLTGWILKRCKYYEILDRVMGSRPNLNPPHTEESDAVGQVGNEDMHDDLTLFEENVELIVPETENSVSYIL